MTKTLIFPSTQKETRAAIVKNKSLGYRTTGDGELQGVVDGYLHWYSVCLAHTHGLGFDLQYHTYKKYRRLWAYTDLCSNSDSMPFVMGIRYIFVYLFIYFKASC